MLMPAVASSRVFPLTLNITSVWEKFTTCSVGRRPNTSKDFAVVRYRTTEQNKGSSYANNMLKLYRGVSDNQYIQLGNSWKMLAAEPKPDRKQKESDAVS